MTNMTVGNFHGASGQMHSFAPVDINSDWAKRSGVALLAMQTAMGWQIIRVIEVSGRDGDLRPFMAMSEAEMYGIKTVLVLEEGNREKRREIARDIDEGLSPLHRLEEMSQAA